MANRYITDLKCVCADTLQYGSQVAISRCKYDRAKAEGTFNTQALQEMHKAILSYLYKKYKHLIEKYNREDLSFESTQTANRNTIWCFWWQGIENAPELVRVCLNSIRKQNTACDVVVIDQNNFAQYVDLPEYIIEKVNNGSISYTHFSDILRFNLLKRYGGIWMDATIFCVNPLQQEYLSAPFFTAKSNESISECVANYRWTCYLMAGDANHIVFDYIVDFYNCYFKDHDSPIHYFLTDYGIQLAYENIPKIKSALDSVPVNNEMRGMLTKHLCDKYTEEYSVEALKKASEFYKLFWKQKYVEYTDDGNPTVWKVMKDYQS